MKKIHSALILSYIIAHSSGAAMPQLSEVNLSELDKLLEQHALTRQNTPCADMIDNSATTELSTNTGTKNLAASSEALSRNYAASCEELDPKRLKKNEDLSNKTSPTYAAHNETANFVESDTSKTQLKPIQADSNIPKKAGVTTKSVASAALAPSRKKIPCGILGCSYKGLKGNVKTHKKRCHSNKNSLRCNIDGCPATCISQQALSLHKTRTHGANQEQIKKCNINGCSYTGAHLQMHKDLAHYQGPNAIKCTVEQCPTSFKSDHALRAHIAKIHPEKSKRALTVLCGISGCLYESVQANVERHREACHYTGKNAIKCSIAGCSISCRNEAAIARHISLAHPNAITKKVHSNCDIPFCFFKGATTALKIHKESCHYKGQDAIQCDFVGCPVSCKNRESLAQHKRIHTISTSTITTQIATSDRKRKQSDASNVNNTSSSAHTAPKTSATENSSSKPADPTQKKPFGIKKQKK